MSNNIQVLEKRWKSENMIEKMILWRPLMLIKSNSNTVNANFFARQHSYWIWHFIIIVCFQSKMFARTWNAATAAAFSHPLLPSTSASANLRTDPPPARKVSVLDCHFFLASLTRLLFQSFHTDFCPPAPQPLPTRPTASPCSPSPCQNGGSCKKGPKRSSFQCVCPDGYSGKFCEVGKCSCISSLILSYHTHTLTSHFTLYACSTGDANIWSANHLAATQYV